MQQNAPNRTRNFTGGKDRTGGTWRDRNERGREWVRKESIRRREGKEMDTKGDEGKDRIWPLNDILDTSPNSIPSERLQLRHQHML